MTNMPPVLPRDRTGVVRHLWVACTEPATHLERALGELLVPDLAHTASMALDQALGKAMQMLLKDKTQAYKQYVENESFRRSVNDMVHALANQTLGGGVGDRAT